VLLVQAFARVLNQSAFAFGSVGLVTLLALAGGALLVSGLERTRAVAAEDVLGFASSLPRRCAASPRCSSGTDGLGFLGTGARACLRLRGLPPGRACGRPRCWGMAVVLLATLASGAAPRCSTGQIAGRLLAWNTLGAARALLAPTVAARTRAQPRRERGAHAVAAVFGVPGLRAARACCAMSHSASAGCW
jgi:hypothetical protein